MKTLIILLNFLLISLMLYSFLNTKIVEYFSGCPSGQNNAVTRQSSQLSQNEQQLSKLEQKYNQLFSMTLAQNTQIAANGQNAKQLSGDVLNKKDEKMKELDGLDKGYKKGGSSSVGGGGQGLNKLGRVMANSPNTSV